MKAKILVDVKHDNGVVPRGEIVEVRIVTYLFGTECAQCIDGEHMGVKFSEHQYILLEAGNSAGEANQNSITALCYAANQNAISKGWYEEPRTFGEIIALLHSELSEALEDYRDKRGLKEIYYEGEKPCGIPIEFADVLIRIFDTCGWLGIDLEYAIKEKMAYNATRPHKHGGKKI